LYVDQPAVVRSERVKQLVLGGVGAVRVGVGGTFSHGSELHPIKAPAGLVTTASGAALSHIRLTECER
jgi:hypothetical protein